MALQDGGDGDKIANGLEELKRDMRSSISAMAVDRAAENGKQLSELRCIMQQLVQDTLQSEWAHIMQSYFRDKNCDGPFVLPEDERPLSNLRIGEEFHMMDKFACKKAKRSTEMWPVPVAPSAAVASNAPDAAAAADAAPRTPKGKKRFDLGAAAAKRANQADSDGLAKAMAEWRPSKMVKSHGPAACATKAEAKRKWGGGQLRSTSSSSQTESKAAKVTPVQGSPFGTPLAHVVNLDAPPPTAPTTSSAALVPVPFADDSENSQVLYGPNGTPPGDSGSDGVSGAGGGALANGQAPTAAPLTADSFRRTPQGRKAVADALVRAAMFHVGQGRRVSGDDGFLLLPAVVQGVRNIKGLPGVTLEQLSQRTVEYFEKHAFQKLMAKKYGDAVFLKFEEAQEDIAKLGALLRRILDYCPPEYFEVKRALLV
jgi:hypothetical protein